MRIIGATCMPRSTIAMLDRENGEITERTLTHDGTTVRDFYAVLPRAITAARAGGSVVSNRRNVANCRPPELKLCIANVSSRLPKLCENLGALW